MGLNNLNRRDFSLLTMAALGGVIAGCGGDENATSDASNTPTIGPGPKEYAALGSALHVCRGLNGCEGQGAGGNNACAGQGECATIAHHECSGQNDCKAEGGCGENPGVNDCSGQGGCAVPLMDHAWDKARESFEARMNAAGTEFGQAPSTTN